MVATNRTVVWQVLEGEELGAVNGPKSKEAFIHDRLKVAIVPYLQVTPSDFLIDRPSSCCPP